jgi:5-(carboxyamino)imidazole ribonucleotide mutase
MNPKVSIIMGSTSDLKVMEDAMKFLDEMEIPFEVNAYSAHRTPELVEKFASTAYDRGVRVIIAAAGGAAHLPGVVAAFTPVPVIGVPINSSNSVKGIDSLLSIVQMPSGIPVATVAIDGARNSAILAVQILAAGDPILYAKLIDFKKDLKDKVVKANKQVAELNYKFIVK